MARKDAMGLITPMTQKDAIGPCEANVGLLRNLTVVLLCNGRATSYAVYMSDRLQLVLHIRRAVASRSEELDLDGAFDLPM